MTGSPMPVHHLSISIARPPAEVYRFASEPKNLPRWARGLAQSEVQFDRGVVIAESPMGTARVRFAEPNALGILDHDVTLPSGETVHNPMRVMPNGSGSEVVFSVFKRPGVTDLSIVTADDQAYSFEVHVTYDVSLLNAQLRQSFPDLPEQPDAKTVFVKLRELRNSW